MRPLRLQVEGFASFKECQQLDLSSLDLFANTGPMGAGKSSLLDAMLFALYGIIPRVGAQNHDELISHGRRIGEAIQLARRRVREQFPSDPTWLAYRCFADPMARVEPPPP